MLSHHAGWPLIEGGSQKLADAMVTALEEQGGEVVTGHRVTDLREFEGVPAVLLDTTPEDFVDDGRRPAARGLPAVGPAVQARCRRLQDRLDPVRAGAVDQRRRPPGRDHPRRRHARGDDRGGAGAQPGPADRQALRARRAADGARPHPRPGGRAHLLGLRARAARCRRRHDRGHRGPDRAVRARVPDTIVARATKNAVQMEQWNPSYLGRRHLQRAGHAAADAGPAGARAGTPTRRRSRASTSRPRRRRRGRPCTACAATCGARVALREVFGVREVPPLRPALR